MREGEDRSVAERLRDELRAGLARRGLSVTQLERRSGLRHTTVSNALNRCDQLPSERTVAALAKALGMDDGPLLELRRSATSVNEAERAEKIVRPGIPISQCDPIDLEVHPAGDGMRDAVATMPGYVRREHDEQLAQVVARATSGQSAMVVLVGTSSAGKTRACWEAIQPLADTGWRLWHPFDPTRAEAALAEVQRVGPRTVVWLNEAQHYFDAGERLAAALHTLLTDAKCAPVLILGTLWPEFDQAYASFPQPGHADRFARTRELLAGRRVTVPDAFDKNALQAAAELAEAGDRLMADVLEREHGGQIAQHLAGAPELLRRYRDAHAPAKALLQVAMDARRLGVSLHLPLGFLAHAALGYLPAHEAERLEEDWLESALAELAQPVHGNLAPLRRIREIPNYGTPGSGQEVVTAPAGPLYRLADFLEQHGRQERGAMCPPASFWHGAYTSFTDDEVLMSLGRAAENRFRFQWADAFYRRVADAGDLNALESLADLQARLGNDDAVEQFARRAAEGGDVTILLGIAQTFATCAESERALRVYQAAADAGSAEALRCLGELKEWAGEYEEAELLYGRAIGAGDTAALAYMARIRRRERDLDGAQALRDQLVSTVGSAMVVAQVGKALERTGDVEAAELLYRRNIGWRTPAIILLRLARIREEAGDCDEAEELAWRSVVENFSTITLLSLARMRERSGNMEGAEVLYRQIVDPHANAALLRVAEMRVNAEMPVLRLYEAAASANTLKRLADLRRRRGEIADAHHWYQRAVDAGSNMALLEIAEMAEARGDAVAAKAAYARVKNSRNGAALVALVLRRERAGYEDEAEEIARSAADDGAQDVLTRLALVRAKAGDPSAAALLRYGLEPDGRICEPWW